LNGDKGAAMRIYGGANERGDISVTVVDTGDAADWFNTLSPTERLRVVAQRTAGVSTSRAFDAAPARRCWVSGGRT